MTFLECAAILPGVRPPVGTIVLRRISSSARRRYRCRRVAILKSKAASSGLLDLISLQGGGDAGHAIHRETFLKLMPRFPVARKLALDVLIGAPSHVILPVAPFSASIEPYYGFSEEVLQYVSGYHEAAGAYDLWCTDGPTQYAFGAVDDDFAETSPGSTAYAQKSAVSVVPDAPAAAETLEADPASVRDDAEILNPNAVTCDTRDGGADCSDMGEHVDATVAAALKDEVCTAAGSNIERHEDPEAVKPPTEAVPIPGGVCVASSTSELDLQTPLVSLKATSPVQRSCLKKGKGDDQALGLRAAAERRLQAVVKNSESVQRVRKLVDDLDLGFKVEAAMLLMNEDSLTEWLADEAVFRCRASALPTASRRQHVLWFIDTSDEAVAGLLPIGMEVWATLRA